MNNNMNNNSQIVGYNPQTGESIYSTNNVNNQVQTQSVRYATFGERFSALLRDLLQILWFAFLGFFLIQIIQIILSFIGIANGPIQDTIEVIKISGSMLFIMFGQPIYALFADSSSKHATKGKLKRNMYVLNKTGNYLTFGESFLRMLLKYLTFFIPFGIIATIIVMCCTDKKQALHDIILGQYVVKKV